MNTAVTRHFVTLDTRQGQRQVHYRRAGNGPAVLLLHQSPQSSREMLDLMARWALHFTVIAPDSPGYGQSDPLVTPAPSIADFAAATGEFADAIGLRRFGVYGHHTGASVGLWLAVAYPGRVSALAANGLSCFDAAERANILANYLPPVTPSWDGAHLAWLWARMRQQSVFFPWHEPHATARLALDMPPPERLQFAVIEFMRAGAHYASAYRAAFESQPPTVLAQLRAPLLVTATPGDPLRVHLERLGTLPPGAATSPATDAADALERCLRHLLAHAGDAAPEPVATRPVAGRLWSTMLHTADGTRHVRLALEGRGEPLVLVHGAGESSATVSPLVARLVGERPVALPDLPGHGESDPATAGGPTLGDAADTVLASSAALGLGPAILAGQGSGAWAVLLAAHRHPLARRRLALIEPPLLEPQLAARWREHGLAPLTPQWHGGHLLAAWHQLRDGRLFFPWFERSRAGARRIEPDLDLHRLQLELRERLIAEGAWQNLWRATLDFDPRQALREPDAALLGAAPTSAWREATRATAALHPVVGCIELPEEPAGWLPALLRHWA